MFAKTKPFVFPTIIYVSSDCTFPQNRWENVENIHEIISLKGVQGLRLSSHTCLLVCLSDSVSLSLCVGVYVCVCVYFCMWGKVLCEFCQHCRILAQLVELILDLIFLNESMSIFQTFSPSSQHSLLLPLSKFHSLLLTLFISVSVCL